MPPHTVEEIIAGMRDQGLCMEPENEGGSINVLTDTLASLADDFELISSLDGL